MMRLFYRKYGSGPPLIILHGLYGSSDNWVTIANRLSGVYTVILPDLRNHGQSPHSNVHNYNEMSHDLDNLVTELGLSRFILAGHSMGGKVAMTYALKWPEKLDGLVIIDISPFGSQSNDNLYYIEHKKILESILSADPSSARSRDEMEEALSSGIKSERTRAFIMKNLRRTNEGNFEWKLNAPSLLSNLPLITDTIEYEGANIPVSGFPVIFVRGGDSDYLEPGDISSIRKIFPAAELITVPGTGHWVHAEKPDEIVKIFLDLSGAS